MIQATLLLFGFCLGSCLQFPLRKYYYVDKLLTWYEAQQYCREHYTDLATFESIDDINRLQSNFSYSWAWIGLWDDPNSWKYGMGNESNSWRWSTTGETSKTGFHMWGPGNPDFFEANEICVLIYNGKWHDVNCDVELSFTCYTVTEHNVKHYVYISSLRTWSSAQKYCRTHYTDLAMIEKDAENSNIKTIVPHGKEAWIGLYRVPWTWSDKSPSLLRKWNSSFINNVGGNQHCASENTLHQWGDENCDSTTVFICHQVVKMTTIVRMTTITNVEMTDPAINAQVLQQVAALLTRQGWTDFKVRWKTPPKKKEKNECGEQQCNTLV